MSKEAMKLALEALEMYCEHGAILRPLEVRDAIKEALAKQKQGEPVAWMEKDVLPLTHIIKAVVRREKDETYTEPLYTTPQQRTWVGLTDEEMKELWEDGGWYVRMFKDVETKLKEKNT